jgi:hypothetical protein
LANGNIQIIENYGVGNTELKLAQTVFQNGMSVWMATVVIV